MMVTPTSPQSVFQLAKALPASPSFHRIYSLQQGWPKCVATPELEAKYGEQLRWGGSGKWLLVVGRSWGWRPGVVSSWGRWAMQAGGRARGGWGALCRRCWLGAPA